MKNVQELLQRLRGKNLRSKNTKKLSKIKQKITNQN